MCRCHFAIQRCDIFSVLSDFFFQRGVSCFALISFCLDCIRYVFYLFLGRDRSPREALAVDAIGFDFIGFYVRKPGNRTIAIADDIAICNPHAGNLCPIAIRIGNLLGFLIQLIDRRLLLIRCRLQIGNILFVCLRLRHGTLDIRQCGVHGAIADLPSHLQHICFDTVHAVQRLAIIRESCCLLLQIGDFAFIRGDFLFGCIQLSLICFISKCVIQIIPLSLQLIYVFHQSAGIITNRVFKSCYFPRYSINRSHIRFQIHAC